MSHPSTPQGLALDEYTDTTRDTHFGTPPDDGEIIFNTTQRTIQFSLDGEWHSVVIFAGTPVEGQMFTYTAGTNRLRPEGVLPNALGTHAALSMTHSDSLAAAVVRGDIMAGNSTPAWAALAVGAAGAALQSDGTDVAWKVAKRTLLLSAVGIMPNETQGCTPPYRIEGSNGGNYVVADFADGEEGSWNGVMPDNYDGGTVTFIFYWIAPTGSSASDTVIFGLKGICFADDDAVDTALGTQIAVTDTVIAVGDVHKSAASAAVTLAGGPAGGEPFIIEIERTGGTMSEEAHLWMVKVIYGTDNYSDE